MAFFNVVEPATTWLLANPSVMLVGFLIYCFVFVLSLFFNVPKPGKNPFQYDSRREPKELEMDQKVRDRVLKQGFIEKRIPARLDAIVIGSGIGGLASAVALAKAGKKVLVLEQHDQAGGCCHTFIEKGFEFDVGIHYIGEMRNNTMVRLLTEQLTDGQLQWVDLIDEFDVVALGESGKQKMYPFCAGGREKWKAGMLKHFPKEEKALDKYLDMLKEVRMNMLGMIMMKMKSKWFCRLLINTGLINMVTKYFKYSSRTVDEVMRELTDDEDLRAVLSYSFGDYGTVPTQGSFAMHAALINHYLYGASYPRGGASEIGFHMIPIIEGAGGRVLVRAPVKEILTRKGRAVGVRVGKSSGDIDVHAPLIISDAGIVNTFKSLLPAEIAEKSSIPRYLNKRVKSGSGATTLYVGLAGTADELKLKSNNIWAFPSNKLTEITEDYLNSSAADLAGTEVPLLFISFPSAKDPTFNQRFPELETTKLIYGGDSSVRGDGGGRGCEVRADSTYTIPEHKTCKNCWHSKGKTVCTVVTLGNWEWFKEWENERVMKRGDEYDTLKNSIGKQMWQQVCAIYPQLEDKVEYLEVGSPVTNKHYIASPKGEIYGLDHTVERFGSPEIMMNLRPETDIPGLLLTGQDVVSCGFMGAMLGGVLCASKALHRNVWEDLAALKTKCDKAKKAKQQ